MKPEPDPMEATVGLLLLHVPPNVASDRVAAIPGHKAPTPSIGPTWADAVREIETVSASKRWRKERLTNWRVKRAISDKFNNIKV
jgi:hypothetical protein